MQTQLFPDSLSVVDNIGAETDPYEFDRLLLRENMDGFIGVDEAGRGPLAGPVFAAAVVLPPDHGILNLRDSKKIGETEREELFDKIISTATFYSVAFSDVALIEKINILQAALSAMKEAVLKHNYALPVIVDGNQSIPGIKNTQRAVVKGDSRSATIAAASILAKVSRDRLMQEMDKKYPQYGFRNHKGYGTSEHLEKLRAFGRCEIHRKTFKGVIA